MKKIHVAAAALLAGTMLAAALPLSLYGGMTAEARENFDYDYSMDGIAGKRYTLSALLEELYGQPVSEVEADWLEKDAAYTIRYCNVVPASYVDLQKNGDVLTVTAKPYSYTAKSGDIISFKPAHVGEKDFEKQGGNYVLTLNEGGMSEDSITVSYETRFTVLSDYLTYAANAAYEEGGALSKKIAEDGEEGTQFLASHSAWAAQTKAYREYLAAKAAYETAEKEYRTYLVKYNDWSKKKQAYDEYLAEYSRYQADKAAYEQYERDSAEYLRSLQAYRDYVAALEKYEKDYAEYLASLNSPEQRTVLTQLAYLDFLDEEAYLENGQPRTLYTAIMGDAVTSVLAQKDALVAYNRSYKKPIELADKVTHLLREDILPRYHALKTASIEERYSFYISYYEATRDALCDLLRALDWLYRQTMVRNGISGMDRVPQYRILLAQLSVICNLLTDGPVSDYDKVYLYGGTRYDFDANYRIDGFAPSELLRGCVPPADGEDARPLAGGVPAMPATPVRPTEVKEPGTMPVRPRVPSEPKAVEPAGEEPSPVEEPHAPAVVEAPGEEPQPFLPTQSERALADAYDRGLLYPREGQSENHAVTFIATCKKYLPAVAKATFRFYVSESGGNFYEVEEKIGVVPDTSMLSPHKEGTGYIYSHAGWLREKDGVRTSFALSEAAAGESYLLYPDFSATPLDFPVTWEIDGSTETAQCPFGESPVYDGSPEMEGEVEKVYRFVGWEAGKKFYPVGESLPPMSENGAHYKARFERVPLVEWSGGEANVTYADGVLSADLHTVYAMRIEAATLFARAAEKHVAVELVRSAEHILFSEEAALAVAESGADSVLLRMALTGAQDRRGYLFAVSFEKDGSAVFPACEITVRAAVPFALSDAYLLSEDGEQMPFRDLGEGAISFTMGVGETYELAVMYRVGVNPSECAEVSVKVKDGLARPGDKVTVEASDFAVGRYLGSVYAVDAEGNELPVTENTFTMPASDVTVGIIAAYHVYTVVFRSEGNVLRTSSYRYGETITPPVSPSKPSDGVFRYTFERWDHEVGVCTGDDEFTAVYSQEKLPEPPKQGPSKLYIIMMAAMIGLPILFAAAVGLIIFFIVRRIRRKKRAKTAEETVPAMAEEAVSAGEEVQAEAPALSPGEGEENASANEKAQGHASPEEGKDEAEVPSYVEAETANSPSDDQKMDENEQNLQEK